jgi:4-cresol dehydrogenase (hydroxylating) flavoprotein subunit
MRELFETILPADAIVSDPDLIQDTFERNVTALSRTIPLVVFPATETDVANIIQIANEHQLALYPISTGRNWSLGSKLPVQDGCVLVNLSRMNRIIEVNSDAGSVIIEPGVTQLQLASHLKAHYPHLTMNFTGSFAYTSVLGNTLERGDGLSARVHDLLGVRGILGSGQSFEAGGIWDFVGTDQPSHYSRYMAGPDLTGLFSQSNFGIVTQIAFRLFHKPERRYTVWGITPYDKLEALTNTLDYFGKQGMVTRGSICIGYANRFVQAKSSLEDNYSLAEAQKAWHFYVILGGTARAATALAEEIDSAARDLCLEHGIFSFEDSQDAHQELPQFLHPFIPQFRDTPDTESIKLIYRLTDTPLPDTPLALDADQTVFGMKAYIPVIPFNGSSTTRANAIVDQLQESLNLNIKLSFFGDGRALITIHFRKDEPDQIRRAEAAEAKLWDNMIEAGFMPYRAAINQMERLVALRPTFFESVRQLKRALDPNNIIAPGRYSSLL